MSTKPSKSASSPSGLLTLDVFNNTIAEHQKTQKETLAQCKRLCEFTKCSVFDLKSENDKLEKIISSLSKRVQDLESANSGCRISSADTIPSILLEITERERCSRNVIIRGTQESSSSVLEDRSKEIAHKLVSGYNTNIRATYTDNMYRPISVTRDRTPGEREAIRLVYADLENRKRNETWLTSEISDSELGFAGFRVIRLDRNQNNSTSIRGGDVLTAIKNTRSFQPISLTVSNVEQHNFFRNNHGSILDLVFTNCNRVTVNLATEYLVIPDPYHSPLRVVFPSQSDKSVYTIEDAASVFNEALLHAIDLFVPTKTFKSLKFPAQTSPSLKNLIMEKNTIPFEFPSNCHFTLDDVQLALNSLKNTNSNGPDGISARLLFNCQDSIVYCLFLLFNQFLDEDIFPTSWKTCSVTLVFKSGDPSLVSNYRPISILLHYSKLFESIVYSSIKRSLNHILMNVEHSFRKEKSTFEHHIYVTVGRALKIPGFLKRNTTLFTSAIFLRSLYFSLVRSVLEYGSVVWYPYQAKDQLRLERVQNRFLSYAAFILKIDHPPHDPSSSFIYLISSYRSNCSLNNPLDRMLHLLNSF
ncbi:Uncharacterized protein FWK35_00008237 [Aphis craccivora]|uniref:Reverse transcriptase domain-containing protein n=1 Tax=Aphis craccivora TaxID=307492 RepID=A0A6G0YX29_APHCR|nr:Uncharacterized protein FWK35_00008237 [Aphis craccivora]